MLVFSSSINVEVAQKLGAKTILWQHTLYCPSEKAVCSIGLRHYACRSMLSLSTGITSVRIENLFCPFLTRHLHLICIDDNDIVAAIHVWCEVRLVLTAQKFCNL